MGKITTGKSKKKAQRMSVYTNLAKNRRANKDLSARRKAEYLATLPKHPIKRILYRLHPQRVTRYWLSKQGGIMALKIIGIGVLTVILLIGGLFLYYRKDLDAIRPGTLAQRVQTTVTKYYDRNDQLLWEDKGEGDYKLVVDGKEIADTMKKATIAIEDRDFEKHNGISLSGLTRSVLSNAQGNSTQGGSTLTQQLVKQVFFPPEETQDRSFGGVPRKIKEMILAIEVERMYRKDQILDLYLNESPYGGRRNGVESAAQTYFGKSAKNLTLAESALLAAIPNQPGLYDPYNIKGHESLIARQHKVLNSMLEMKYISKTQADEAKKYPILDNIKPLADQLSDIKAPHFVLYVRQQLSQELGKATVGRGGLRVKTSLDLRIQQKLEESMNAMFASSTPAYAGFTNGASVVEDNQTGQIVAMLGSRDYRYEGFGQDNAAIAYIQPGSTIKPMVFAQLFSDQGPGKQNFGSGSILADDSSMTKIYGAPLRNADGKFLGSINLRKALALSRNVPAVKAMHIAGKEPTWEMIRALGDKSYCTKGPDAQAGLSSAIGGCGTRMIDHVNAFSSLARMGTYRPTASILEVKNSQGTTIKKYKEDSKQVLDPQAAYILSDILSDDNARAGLYGRNLYGLVVPGVRTAIKTGTSDKDGKPKDLWNLSYSSALTMGVWLGNSDTSILSNGNSSIPARIIGQVMEYAHKDVYAPEGKWKSGDWFTQPQGIQRINGELFPSWYNKAKAQTNSKLVFDRASKKKITACTPDSAKIEVDVLSYKDPASGIEAITAPDGYDATKEDDLHKCDDARPVVRSAQIRAGKVRVDVAPGTFALRDITVRAGDQVIYSGPVSTPGLLEYPYAGPNDARLSVTLTDEAYYSAAYTE